jgi:tyrosine-protein kinase Etk/Wzc
MGETTNNAIFQVDDFKSAIRIFTKNWHIFVFFLALSYGAYKWYSNSLVVPYVVSTKLLLKAENPGDPQKPSYMGIAYSAYVDYSNEISVIRSYELIERTIDKLKLDVSYFIKGRFKNIELYEGLPFRIVLTSVNAAICETDILFRIIDENYFELTYSKSEFTQTRRFPFNQAITDPDFKIEVIKNNLINKQTVSHLKEIEYIVQLRSKSALVNKYLSELNASIPEYSAIMNLSLEDVIPQRATMFLDTLAKVYVDNTLRSQIEVNEKTLLYIEKQLNEANGLLNSIEKDIVNYKEKKGILDLSKQEQRVFEYLTGFETDKKKLDLQLGSMDALEKYIIEDKDPELLPPSFYIANEDAFLKSSVAELYQMQMSRKGELINATEKNMAIFSLDKKIASLKSNILTYIGNTRKALKSKIAEIAVQISKYENTINDIPKKQRDIVNMQRQLQVNEKMSMFLMERRANMIISKAAITSGSKIIEKAHTTGMARPKIPNVELAFLGSGFLLSLIIAFIRSYLYEKIDNLVTLKSKTDLPILGEINYVNDLKGQSNLLVGPKTRSLVTEAFRVIRTNLQYTPTKGAKESKVVLVTSHRPGEGKTFCSVNLGAILARAGKRVLLIELDLHKPSMENSFGWTSPFGASNVLNNEITFADALIKNVVPNMDVLLSGDASESASELILSEQMEHLIEYGKSHYDYVLLDTAPVGLISDAIVLMPYADISIFIVNTKFDSKASIAQAHEIVAKNKPANFCFILNGVKFKKLKYAGYANYAGYTYGAEKNP